MGLGNHLSKARARIGTVALLRAETPRGEDDLAVIRPFAACERFEPGINRWNETQRKNINPDLHGCRDLVNILPARAGCGKEPLLKRIFGKDVGFGHINALAVQAARFNLTSV